MSITDTLNLELGLKRALLDLEGRTFVYDVGWWEVVKHSSEKWIADFYERLNTRNYEPTNSLVCEVPKPNFCTRPGAWLVPEDHVLYCALVGALLPGILERLDHIKPSADYCNPVNTNPDKTDWSGNWFKHHQNYLKDSLEQLEKKNFVLFSDVAGFYENVDIRTLSMDLKDVGGNEAIIQQLVRCLNRWSQIDGRGLPQGFFASDILAKLYLCSVDQGLRDFGCLHYRWNDDFRIFCSSEIEAKRSLCEFLRLLRYRGLSIQSHKTQILSGEVAGEKIAGIAPKLNRIAQDYREQLFEALELDDDYFPLGELESQLAEGIREEPLAVIKRAFDEYCLNPNAVFDQSMTRFLLKRLGNLKDPCALDFSIELLETQPQETPFVLNYFKLCDLRPIDELVARMSEVRSLYPFQSFLILRYLNEIQAEFGDQPFATIKRWAFDESAPLYLRSLARSILGELGTRSDKERLEREYSRAFGFRNQVDVIFALRSSEKSWRNSFLGKVKSDSVLHGWAVDFVRETS